MTIGNENSLTAIQPAEVKTNLHIVSSMLDAGRYDEAAEFLRRAQEISANTGHNALSDVLVATRQICLVCSQLQIEMERHRRAQKDAWERECELKRQLFDLFNSAFKISGEILPPGSKEATREDPIDRPPRAGNQPHSSASLAVNCLGMFRIYRNDQIITQWHSLKGQSIFKYMVAHHGTPIPKDLLMDVFWPNADPENARRNLHQAIYSLRQTMRRGEPYFQPIQFENDCYTLNPEISLWLDSEEFARNAQAGRQLEASERQDEAAAAYQRAEELYLGDFLEEDLYEDWTGPMRQRYRNAYLDLLDRLSEYQWRKGNYPAVIELCGKLLAKDNCNEKAHRRLMQCYQKQGQHGLAVRQYRLCVDLLKNELGVSPSIETRNLFSNIIQAHA
jgi:DNA-binding SARP family transcriptional activator